MKLSKTQYAELETARDEHLQEKLTKHLSRFLDPLVWTFGSAVDVKGLKPAKSGLLIFIPYEAKKDFGL